MSMSTMGANGEIQIPNGWAGQIDSEPSLESRSPLENRVITGKFQEIDYDIEQISQKASTEDYGLSKICPVVTTDVTSPAGLVLGAFEKNESITGSMAYNTKLAQEKANSFDVVVSPVVNACGVSFFNAQLFKTGKLGFCDLYIHNSGSVFGDGALFYFPDGFKPLGTYYKYGQGFAMIGGTRQPQTMQFFINETNNTLNLVQQIGAVLLDAQVSFCYRIQ